MGLVVGRAVGCGVGTAVGAGIKMEAKLVVCATPRDERLRLLLSSDCDWSLRLLVTVVGAITHWHVVVVVV